MMTTVAQFTSIRSIELIVAEAERGDGTLFVLAPDAPGERTTAGKLVHAVCKRAGYTAEFSPHRQAWLIQRSYPWETR